ncbi:MAG: DUF169 domain-containing protein [Methanimicrococcus sp.]|nr:DUF169 domain-containing protein [Methanimicrococcus sp.]
MDVQKINEIGNEFKKLLHLDGSPVAVKLIPAGKEGEIPSRYQKLDRQLRHCQIVDHVRRTGDCFYTTAGEHLCNGGAAALGLGKLPEKVKTGEFYCDGLKQFETIEAAKKTVDMISFLEPFSNAIVLYAPLESTPFEPDVIIFICKPKQAMLLTQGYLYKDGGRIHAEFSGKQSVCSDAVAQVVKSGQPNVTIGCGGSRSYAKIMDEEMLYSFPFKDIEKTVQGLGVLIGNLG